MAAGQRRPFARGHRERVHPAIAVVDAELSRQPRMQRERRAGQRTERRAVAPVERDEAAGLPGGRARDACALDDRHTDAAQREEVRDGGADDAGAANGHVARCAHRYLLALIRMSSDRSTTDDRACRRCLSYARPAAISISRLMAIRPLDSNSDSRALTSSRTARRLDSGSARKACGICPVPASMGSASAWPSVATG